MKEQQATCPTCGSPVVGAFCHQCGTRLGASSCPGCGAAVSPGNRFCPACGRGLGGARPSQRRSWLIPASLGVAIAVTLIGLALSSRRQAAAPTTVAPVDAGTGQGAPPDLSNLTPRERFDRLYQRIISAAQTGDQATVERFTPMAVAAFGMLDEVDPDARYHLAMLQLHVGDLAGAEAQADSLRRLSPDHLFGYVVGGAVARFRKDDADRAKQYRAFLDRYDAEMATDKAEYTEPRAMLLELKKTADSLR